MEGKKPKEKYEEKNKGKKGQGGVKKRKEEGNTEKYYNRGNGVGYEYKLSDN